MGTTSTSLPRTLAEAARLLQAGLEAQLRVHLPLEALEAFAEGKILKEEWDSVADHVALCGECNSLLRFGVLGQKESDEQVPDQWIEQDWARVQQRLRMEDRIPADVKAAPAAALRRRVVSEWTRFEEPAGSAESAAADTEIEGLYDEVTALTRARQEAPNKDGRKVIDLQLKRAVTRLRKLQAEEAERFRKDFDSRLDAPLGTGRKLLDQADRLIEELEDLTSADTSAG